MPEASIPRDEIRSGVREYLLTEFLPGEDPAALTDSTPLISGGILDSIASVKLVSHLEERYGIRFEAHEVSVDYLDTVDLVVGTVQRKLGG
jgi:acyl carrier protein